MNEQEKVEKLKEVFADKAFAEKVFGLDTAEAVQGALAEKGVELSVQEIVGIRDVLVKQQESGEEIAPEQLKSVAGGIVISAVVGIILGAIGATASTASATHTISGGRW